MRYVARVTAVVALAATAAGATTYVTAGAEGPPPPPAVEVGALGADEVVSPINEQLAPSGQGLRYARQVNGQRAACLVERGWPEGTAPIPEGADAVFEPTPSGLRAYAEAAGFGFATMWVSPEAQAHQVTAAVNAEWIGALDDSERARYGADSLECMQSAEANAAALVAGPSSQRVAELMAANDWVAAHPQVVTATEAWAQCMADAGYDATTPESFRDSFADFGVTIDDDEATAEIAAAVTATDCAVAHLWPTTKAVEELALAQLD